MAGTEPDDISNRQRAVAAMQDRRDGMLWDEIAEKHGYSDRGNAQRAVRRVLERVEGETAEDFREVMSARYEALYAKAWDSINTADAKGQLVGKSQLIASARGVLDSHVKLLGLQAVSKSEVTVVTRGQMDAEIEVLLGHGGIAAGMESDSDPEENS